MDIPRNHSYTVRGYGTTLDEKPLLLLPDQTTVLRSAFRTYLAAAHEAEARRDSLTAIDVLHEQAAASQGDAPTDPENALGQELRASRGIHAVLGDRTYQDEKYSLARREILASLRIRERICSEVLRFFDEEICCLGAPDHEDEHELVLDTLKAAGEDFTYLAVKHMLFLTQGRGRSVQMQEINATKADYLAEAEDLIASGDLHSALEWIQLQKVRLTKSLRARIRAAADAEAEELLALEGIDLLNDSGKRICDAYRLIDAHRLARSFEKERRAKIPKAADAAANELLAKEGLELLHQTQEAASIRKALHDVTPDREQSFCARLNEKLIAAIESVSDDQQWSMNKHELERFVVELKGRALVSAFCERQLVIADSQGPRWYSAACTALEAGFPDIARSIYERVPPGNTSERARTLELLERAGVTEWSE